MSSKSNLMKMLVQSRLRSRNMKTYKKECEDAKVKLDAVRALLAEQYAKLQAMRAKIEEALADFKDKGVEVYYKDGSYM
jgi:chemotaxis protein MotB